MKHMAASVAGVVLFTAAAAAGSAAVAQCATDDRGRARYSSQLTKLDEEQIRQRVKTLAARDGKTRARLELHCTAFKGADLVKVLNTAPTDAAGDYWTVRINRSIIEDGLPLRRLVRVSVAAMPEPYGAVLAWARSGRSKRWRNRNREVPVFRGAMTIGNSVILGGRENPITGERTVVDGRGVYFMGRVNIVNVQLTGSAEFTDSIFGEGLRVRRADFRGRARFGGVALLKRSRFDAVIFRDDVNFSGARSLGLFRFFRTTIDGELSFRRALFCDRLSMVRVRANSPADFSSSIFFKRLSLSGVRFVRSVQFRRARLPEGIRVDGGRLGTYADFSAARIGYFDMRHRGSRAVVTARLDFRRARIDRVLIANATFTQEVDFSDAVIGEAPGEEAADPRRDRSSLCPARKSATVAGASKTPRDAGAVRYGLSLINVTFEDGAGFLRARLPLSAEFRRVKFRGPADFTDARFVSAGPGGRSEEFGFSYVDLGTDTRIRWAQLPALKYWKQRDGLQPLSSVLGGLEKYFRGREQLGDANAAYRHFEAMRRAELSAAASAALGAKGVSVWRALLTPDLLDFVTLPELREALAAEAKWLFWGLPAGYGTRIWRLLLVALAIQLIFALLYYTLGTVARRLDGRAHAGSWLRLFDFPDRYLGEFDGEEPAPVVRRRFRDAFWASLLLTFKLGRAEVRIHGGTAVRLLVRLQWLIGYFILAAIVLTLGKTQPAVGALVGYLF